MLILRPNVVLGTVIDILESRVIINSLLYQVAFQENPTFTVFVKESNLLPATQLAIDLWRK